MISKVRQPIQSFSSKVNFIYLWRKSKRLLIPRFLIMIICLILFTSTIIEQLSKGIMSYPKIYFGPMSHFYTSWKNQLIFGFLALLTKGDINIDYELKWVKWCSMIFLTPWKLQNPGVFLTSSRGREMEYWTETG